MGSSFPIDIVLFGMIAAFLVVRLVGILGKRTGFERPAQPVPAPGQRPAPIIEGVVEPAAATASRRELPDPTSPTGQIMASMRRTDPAFEPGRFVDGAEQAFRMIVGAYAAGDRVTLQGLLSPHMASAFSDAIATREGAGETQRTDIRAIDQTRIEEASLTGTVAAITVRFVSDQISLLTARDGSPVTGTDAVTEITDIWTFERDLAVQDPTWRLTAARSA